MAVFARKCDVDDGRVEEVRRKDAHGRRVDRQRRVDEGRRVHRGAGRGAHYASWAHLPADAGGRAQHVGNACAAALVAMSS